MGEPIPSTKPHICINFAKTEFPYREKNKKERPYISHISPGAPLQPTDTNLGLRVRLVDFINCAKFYRNRLRGLDSVRGRTLTILIGLRCRR